MPTETKEKVAKGKISDFQKQCKLLFSSLSARGCTKLYINLPGREDELILSNADPDLLTTYSSQNLIAIHRIRPDKKFLDKFREIFFSGGDPKHPYLIKTEFITRSFKDDKIEQALSQINALGELTIKGGGKDLIAVSESEDDEDADDEKSIESGEPDFRDEIEKLLEDDGWDTEIIRTTFRDATVAGIPINDPYVLNKLEDILREMQVDYNYASEGKNDYKVKYRREDLVSLTKSYANWYYLPKFNPASLIPGLNPDDSVMQSVLMCDGLNAPSIFEFLKKDKKVYGEDAIFELYVYPYTENTVKTISHYGARTIDIISTRPYFYEILALVTKDKVKS